MLGLLFLEASTDLFKWAYAPPDAVIRCVLHGHLTHLLHLRSASSSGKQRQVVAPHFGIITVVLQRSRQSVQGCF